MTGRRTTTLHHYLQPKDPHDMTEEELRRLRKQDLIKTILWQRDQAQRFERELTAAQKSYQELERVQQAIVARLEQAYEAVVKSVLDRRGP